MLVAGLLVGFAFAGKIQEESRVRAVGKIALLLATATVFLVIITFSGNSYYWAYTKESLQNMYSTGAWTTTDWFVYEQLALFMNVALNVALSLVVSFIGLYSARYAALSSTQSGQSQRASHPSPKSPHPS